MKYLSLILAFGFFAGLLSCRPAAPAEGPTRWSRADLPVASSLRALSTPGPGLAWVGGSAGALFLTTDGGRTWQDVAPPGTDSLDFRDLAAFDGRRAVAMSAGPGAASRIYRTVDGGKAWTLVWQNREPSGFFNAVAFWDERRGLLAGDPVEGRPYLLRTDDGGQSWIPAGADHIPAVDSTEYGFAASGSHLQVGGDSLVWLGSGGSRARVFHSRDGGRTWEASATPMRQGQPSTGIFSLAFREDRRGMAVGGDYQSPDDRRGTVARSTDGGRSWTLPDPALLLPYRSCVLALPDGWLACGPGGTDFLPTAGEAWVPIDTVGWHVLARNPAGQLWAAGADGRVGWMEGGPMD